IVFGEPGPHTLKVDEASGSLFDDDILRLKIAMNEHARERGESFGDLMQARPFALILDHAGLQLENATQAILEKVVLLPTVKVGTEFGLKFWPLAIVNEVRLGMKGQHLLEGLDIKRAADWPRFMPKTPEISHSEIFHPNETLDVVIEGK